MESRQRALGPPSLTRRAFLRTCQALVAPLVLVACNGQTASVGTPAATVAAQPTATAMAAAPSSPTPLPTAQPSPPAPTVAAATPSPTAALSVATPTVSPTSAPAAAARPAETAQAPNVRVDVVARNLDTPWAIAFAPDGRVFLTERPGRVRIVRDGQLLAEPWATFDVFERDGSEAGLLGIALDPQFAQNRYVYVAYTYSDDRAGLRNRLVRLRDSPSTGRGAVDRVLLDDIRGNTNHDGGRVAFGPDGKLYLAMGDAQVPALAQDRSSLNGKILRLNPDGTVPPDNPFSGSPVYSLGHRNPQGLAWEPGSGRLYATEHGPSGGQGAGQDELNLIEPGKNYGWPEVRGDQSAPGMVAPVLHSTSATTWAPGGATFVTRGPWQGSLLFAALRGQALYRVTFDRNDPRKVLGVEAVLQGQYGRLRDVAEGPDGALYVLTSNRDGRGRPASDDDRVLRLRITR